MDDSSLRAELAAARAENLKLIGRVGRLSAVLVDALIALTDENPARYLGPIARWARGDTDQAWQKDESVAQSHRG